MTWFKLDMESATPKINASLRQQFISQNVSMIGKCVSVTNDRAVLEADGQVPVSFNKVCYFNKQSGG